MGVYVNARTARCLRSYKYSGEDRSYLFKLVLNPTAAALVEFVPRCVAPNLITVTGLALIAAAATLTTVLSPDLTATLPASAHFICAVSILMYQTLDNMDGKQARRTGNSTAYGLLMDHGVDAMAVTVVSIMMGSILQLGGTWRLFAIWAIAMTPFTMATWEEYYTGSLVLAELNGPSDGQFILAVCCLLPAVFGAGFWSEVVTLPFVNVRTQRNVLVVLLGITAMIPTVILNVANVLRSSKTRETTSARLSTLFPFIVLLTNASIWMLMSPARIVELHPRMFLLANGFTFGNLACKLMFAHIGGFPYATWRAALVPVSIAALNAAVGAPVDESLVAVLCLTTAFLAWLHFVVIATKEITDALGIRVFFVK
ncbi:CDP-alcohol phosphatidyltransferase [Plasmodiophora brassicae]|uniref:CDP-alcohol phosphatidyltransferase n=1 Tax=Plasmodiophora brassicae TaxID=37360 RepID=A0A0G4IHC1_PLABS|nr:hypothetical protein PBRA_000368 [Plasmodiophora brassicae]SPQ96927.1 unnamed protein product [Plasmodiophora brassicae]